MSSDLPDNPSILVIRGGAIGDFILTLPAIAALRQKWPESRIEILGYKRIIALAERRYYAQAVRSIDAAPMASFFVQNGKLDADLSEYFASFDIVLSYLYDPDEIFSVNLRRAGVVQLISGSAKPESEHAALHFARPIESLGLRVENPQPKIFPNAEDRAAAESFLSTVRPAISNAIAIHPGSGGQYKVWPIDHWKIVIQALREKLGRNVLLVGGEADEDVRAALEPLHLPWAWSLSLPELAAVLEKCAFYIGHDSGITHLAAAVGVPTLALFGPTAPEVWAPRGSHVKILRRGLSMAAIHTETVLDMLKRLMNK